MKGSYHVLLQIDTFAVGKDEWNTKEDTGKSMKNTLYVLQYVRGTSQAEVMSVK